MPDLPDRRDREAAMAAVLLLLFSQYGPLGGSIVWEIFEADVANRLVVPLRSTYAASARGLVLPGLVLTLRDLDIAANQWAGTQAASLARDVATRTRQYVQEAFRTAANPADLERQLTDIFGRSRAELIAATEITRANVAGEQYPVAEYEAATGITLVPLWHTELDDFVCPICEPLDGMPDDTWGDLFPLGPPAHPNCRCWLSYVPEEEAAFA